MKTNELTGAALDWAVAKCEGWIDNCNGWLHQATLEEVADGHYKPSTDWAQGGPIIEREVICIGSGMDAPTWYANKGCGKHHQFGRTPLIAAMRCYVASKLGDEVELPEGLQ